MLFWPIYPPLPGSGRPFWVIFTAALGHSRFLVSGTTNTIAIMIQSGTSEILSTYYRGVLGVQRELLALNIVLQLVLCIGIFQVAASFLRLTQFTSRLSLSLIWLPPRWRSW